MSLQYNGHTFAIDGICKCCIGDKRVVVIDPTNTGKLRAKFRMAMGQRWNQLRELTKLMLNKQDLLSLKSGGLLSVTAPAITHAGSKVDIFQRWFDLALENAVLQKDGSFMRPFLEAAYAQGTSFGQQQAKSMQTHNLAGHRSQALVTLARVELQGIIEAVSQQAIRAVTNGLLTNARPMAITRQVLNVIETVGRNRSNAMIELLTVRAHAEASLDIYEAAGLATVGLLPESRAQAKVVTDAQTQSKAKGKAKDAKRSGPGSRSRGAVPSQSTISRIRRAELNTARRLGESVNVRTAGDNDVCPVCEAISEEGPYSINTARGLIPAHPHCRCVFVPAGDARFAQEDIRSVIGSYRANEYELGQATAGLSSSDVAAIFANSLIDWVGTDEWREEDHPRGPDGKFGSGGGSVDPKILSENEAKVPREGTRKHEVYQTYMKHGRAAAIEHAKRLGLAPGTAGSWTGSWKREGSPGGTHATPPAPPSAVTPPAPASPAQQKAAFKPPSFGGTAPYAKTVAGGGRQHYIGVSGDDPGTLHEIRKGVNAIPLEHQDLIARAGIKIHAVKNKELPSGVLGRYRYYEGGRYRPLDIQMNTGEQGPGRYAVHVRDKASTTVHELGHALDHAKGWKHSDDFASHIDEDAKAMTPVERIRASYYFSNKKERFAELYAAAYTPGERAFGGMPIERARHVFAKSIARLKRSKLT